MKKFFAVAMALLMSICNVLPVMAETEATPQVFVSFISAGQTVGKFITQGTSTTAPDAVFLPGYTFCGYDKSLKNIQTHTQFTAVYLPDYFGEEAIKAKKASLPTPAISKTSVATPDDVNTDRAMCLPQQAQAFSAQAMVQAANLMTSAAAQAQAAQTLQAAAVQAASAASQYAQAQAALTNIMTGAAMVQNAVVPQVQATAPAVTAAQPAVIQPVQSQPAQSQPVQSTAAQPAQNQSASPVAGGAPAN